MDTGKQFTEIDYLAPLVHDLLHDLARFSSTIYRLEWGLTEKKIGHEGRLDIIQNLKQTAAAFNSFASIIQLLLNYKRYSRIKLFYPEKILVAVAAGLKWQFERRGGEIAIHPNTQIAIKGNVQLFEKITACILLGLHLLPFSLNNRTIQVNMSENNTKDYLIIKFECFSSRPVHDDHLFERLISLEPLVVTEFNGSISRDMNEIGLTEVTLQLPINVKKNYLD